MSGCTRQCSTFCNISPNFPIQNKGESRLFHLREETEEQDMKRNCRLLIADIDLTLVNREKQIMPETRRAMELLKKNGTMLAIASGRPVKVQLINRYKEWGLPYQFDAVIGLNGGQLYDNISEQYHEYNVLKKEYIKEIIEFMAPLNLNYFIYKDGYMLVNRMDEGTKASCLRNNEPAVIIDDPSEIWAEDTGKLMFRLEDESQMPEAEALAAAHPSAHYQYFKTNPLMLEFQDPANSKGSAMKEFCAMHDIPLSDVIAFGDTTNDNEMIEYSGTGVCMINGSDDTKAAADFITEYDYEHDGMGRWLMKHVIGEGC